MNILIMSLGSTLSDFVRDSWKGLGSCMHRGGDSCVFARGSMENNRSAINEEEERWWWIPKTVKSLTQVSHEISFWKEF